MNQALGTNKPSMSVVLALTGMTQSATKHKKSPSEAGADSSHKTQCFEKRARVNHMKVPDKSLGCHIFFAVEKKSKELDLPGIPLP